MDVDKTIAWKQSLVFFGGLMLAFIGIFLMPVNIFIALPINIAGLGLLGYNLVANFKSKQAVGVKLALIFPKVFFLWVTLISSFAMFFHTVFPP